MSSSYRFDPPDHALGTRARRGALIIGGTQFVKMGVQALSVVLLSRLLSPSDFGVVAMCAPIIAFMALFQDLGLSQAVIQKKDLIHDEVAYIYWINVGIASIIALLLLVLAPAVGAFYHDDRVGLLTAASAGPVIVVAFGIQHIALINRRMQMVRFAVLDTGAPVVSLVATVSLALVHPSFWAIFAGQVAGTLFTTIGAWMLHEWRPSRYRKISSAGGMVRFGAGLTGFSLANFFARNLDNVLIGRYYGDAALGAYDRAYKLFLFPLSQITYPLAKVIVPTLSRLTHDASAYRNAYIKTVTTQALVISPGICVVVPLADILVPLLLGAKWQDSVPIFQALGICGLLQQVNSPCGWLFISQARGRDFMFLGIIAALITVAAIIIGLPYGPMGVAIGYTISEYIRTPLLWWYVGRSGPVKAADLFHHIGPILFAAHGAMAATWYTRAHLDLGTLPTMVACVAVSAATFPLLILPFSGGRLALHRLLQEAKRLVLFRL
jgi:PST family polysaccharide transporter